MDTDEKLSTTSVEQDVEELSTTSAAPEVEELVKSGEKLNDTASHRTCLNSTVNCSSNFYNHDTDEKLSTTSVEQDVEKLSITSAEPEVEELVKSGEKLNDTASHRTCLNSTVNCSSNFYNDDDYVKITYIYLFSLCLSPILHVLDVGTDAYLAFQYWKHSETAYFISTATFVAVPALISTFFSLRMYARDLESASHLKWTLRCVLLGLQIGPVVRYVEALQHALVLKRPETTPAEYKKHSAALLKEDSDLALLRILECFLEAAPQQVLQITILMTPGSPNVPTVLQIYLYMSLLTSFLSTSWTFAMYHRSIRFAQKNKVKLKWTATIVQFFWIFFIMTSRILAISEAASVYPKGTLAVCIIHWLVMTVWLSVFEKTWFCISPTDLNFKNKVKEVSFCAVMGLVYIFSFVAVNDQPTRYKYTFYYSVCFLENSSSSIAWILESANSEAWILLLPPLTIFIVFALGIVMMLVYYSYYHPSMCYDAEVVMSLPNVALSPPVVKKNNHDSFTLAMGT